jgi:hypothetical protein
VKKLPDHRDLKTTSTGETSAAGPPGGRRVAVVPTSAPSAPEEPEKGFFERLVAPFLRYGKDFCKANMIALAVTILIAALRRRVVPRRTEELFLLLPAGLLVIGHIWLSYRMGYVEARHVLLEATLALGWAAVGIVEFEYIIYRIVGWIYHKRGRRFHWDFQWFGWLVMAAFIVLGVGISLNKGRRPQEASRAAAVAIRARMSEENFPSSHEVRLMMTDHSDIAFYVDNVFLSDSVTGEVRGHLAGRGSLQNVVDVAKEPYRAAFLVIDMRLVRKMRAQELEEVEELYRSLIEEAEAEGRTDEAARLRIERVDAEQAAAEPFDHVIRMARERPTDLGMPRDLEALNDGKPFTGGDEAKEGTEIYVYRVTKVTPEGERIKD